MRQLLPSYAEDIDLLAAYAYPPDRPWVRANMVSSLAEGYRALQAKPSCAEVRASLGQRPALVLVVVSDCAMCARLAEVADVLVADRSSSTWPPRSTSWPAAG